MFVRRGWTPPSFSRPNTLLRGRKGGGVCVHVCRGGVTPHLVSSYTANKVCGCLRLSRSSLTVISATLTKKRLTRARFSCPMLSQACLVESRETSEYSRCGRTDKGVSVGRRLSPPPPNRLPFSGRLLCSATCHVPRANFVCFHTHLVDAHDITTIGNCRTTRV